MRLLLFLALAMAVGVGASAQVYKWKDTTGKTHYGDSPPEESKAEEVKVSVRSHSGPVQVTDWSAILRKKAPAAAAGPQSITMYATSWCVHCKRARKYFGEKGISFREVDVEASDENKREFKALGGGGVPLILIGEKAMRGFSPEAFEYHYRKS